MTHKHLLYMPFTGLGLYNGYRGDRWLRNRIKIFKQFVLPSLLSQTNKDFVLWISWRWEEKNNPIVKEFVRFMDDVGEFKTVHTFHGLCIYDDKYPDQEARERLVLSIHRSVGDLFDVIGESDEVYMTIQPSDDCYASWFVESCHKFFENNPNHQAFGLQRGYICDYLTKQIAEYNPLTNPPFYTIRFPREDFVDALKHVKYTALKHDTEKYNAGTPLPSHEYVYDVFPDKYGVLIDRGFCVGCHSENISTFFNHPFKGADVSCETLKEFGIYDMPCLVLPRSFRKWLLRKMPDWLRRKLRNYGGLLYRWLRS